MFVPDPEVTAVVAAHREGRHAEALPLLEQLFVRAEREGSRGGPYFMTMFVWQMMLEEYAPARVALQAVRDEQVAQFLAGELYFGPHIGPAFDADPWRRTERFSIIRQINDDLKEPASTCALFTHLDETNPALARKYAYMALPAVVAMGDWTLAERYRGDPLSVLAECNQLVHRFPLFPSGSDSPRLSATLMGLMKDVHIALAVLDGTGRADEAAALRLAVLDGLEDPAMRDLAQRELATPGAISSAMSAHRMALDGITPP